MTPREIIVKALLCGNTYEETADAILSELRAAGMEPPDVQPDFVVLWDGDCRKWLALGRYIKGLAIQADTLGKLGNRLEELVPILMKANEQRLRPMIVDSQGEST